MATSPRVREGQCQLSMVLGFQHTWFLWPSVVAWTMEINTDPSCNRNTDPDMVLGIITGTDITMNPVAVLAT